MSKAQTPKQAIALEQVPNIGKRIAGDFRLLGIRTPAALKGNDPYRLYAALCRKTHSRQDPCVLDTFMAAVSFMNGKGVKPWWEFTEQRKKKLHKLDKYFERRSK